MSKNDKTGRVTAQLFVLALFFSAGAVLGQVLSVRCGSSEELNRYLEDFFRLEHTSGGIGTAVLVYFRYPVLAFLMGFTAVGVLFLPLLSACFGFFLSFATCSFVSAYGDGGLLLAASVLGLRCLVTLPCYFCLAPPALRDAWSALGRGRRILPPEGRKAQLWRFAACAAILLAGALCETVLGPYLARMAWAKI